MGAPTVLRIHPADNVVIARRQLVGGTVLAQEAITVAGLVPPGHKIAARAIAAGDEVRRYGQVIGRATMDIAAGQHVHTHNLAYAEGARAHEPGIEARPVAHASQPATFEGIVRADGRIATRNYIGVLTRVNCSATVARAISDAFRRDLRPGMLDPFPHVDGVVALTHGMGCATASDGEELQVLRRTLGGYARHANFAAVLVVGLGCETNQIQGLLAQEALHEGAMLATMNIQETGGTARTVALGIEAVQRLLPQANQVRRVPVPASHLVVGLQCGGSDGYSGITANPALGAAVDRLVGHGGTAILSETPEIYGAEHLLTRRAASHEVADKLLRRIGWWEDYTARNRMRMDNNPSAGNKAGGLTTILEKSLGAVAKSGTTPLNEVYEFAQPVTTGRGSAYGCAPTPSLKLSTNSELWRRQQDDIDLDCGGILEGAESVDACGERIFKLMLDTASGRKTRSELHGYAARTNSCPGSLGL